MKRSDFDFDLPEELVAQRPLPARDGARMMVVHRQSGKIEDRKFLDISEYLKKDDLLIFNRSKVIPARLCGKKPSGGKSEVFLLTKISENRFHCLVKNPPKQKKNNQIFFHENFRARVLEETSIPMVYAVEFETSENGLDHWLEKIGQVPLPPYIRREPDASDYSRYQTIFSKEPGSVAAPTAGLHFTKEVIAGFLDHGIRIGEVLLHIGLGTFQPIKVEALAEHRMHTENFYLEQELKKEIARTKKMEKRVIAVGTTSVRALESDARGMLEATDLFLHPGEKFRVVDAMFTNFHQPQSSLVVMVAAFMQGEDMQRKGLWREAYQKAVELKYRFFSYGDAMLIL